MKQFTITENGTFPLNFRDYDRAAVYLVGSLGGGTAELVMFGTVIHILDPTVPVLVSMGRGAPLEVRITGATTFINTKVVGIEVR